MEPISTIEGPGGDDPFVSDPPAHPWPPTSVELPLVSGGHRLLNSALLPAGTGPHPVVLLLHGFPGHDTWQDLAQVLRRAGYAAVTPHYRGSWGSPGSWSWAAALDDARAVVTALRDDARFDGGRISLVGHSFGGFVALQTLAADPTLDAAVSIAGFDFGRARREVGEPGGRARYEQAWGGLLAPLRGTTARALVDEMMSQGERWSLPALAPHLTGRRVLLVGTGRDQVTPAAHHHAPVAEAFRRHGVALSATVLDTDHALADSRVRAAREVLQFLGPARRS
ncbi:alpha/beta hydrolase family protein [Krasilnikoviella flava]|uniref:Alpha/beta hydrolase family protein n=1 Tax=Krasilnikoviella flava TaxID=526729 RepID=A0A1T5I7K3_9MICO|nr:alpha/beta fold hydrolase [Krasilnikoviella flava]SKC35010.1 Alpha/beta hydrolase family protein [Krasilnikoviella flava]